MIKQIKSKITCPDYLLKYGIHVRPGGRCISPLRPGAKNPTSFYVDADRWYDFGSGSGGDVIDLEAQLKHNGDVGAAIRSLAAELGIQSQASPRWKADIQNLCNRTAAYHAALTDTDYDYLAARGLSKDDVERLMIGRVTDGFLQGRLFLPYFKNGAVVYYATRAMPDGEFPESKYMKASLRECESYEHIPWGFQTLNREQDTLIISEGYFDAAAWEANGFSVLSPITGNFSKEQWPDVISACRMFKRVCIIFDNDPVSHAGESFTVRAANNLLASRVPFIVGHTPAGVKDVNDYYVAGGDLQLLIDTAVDGLSFMALRCNTVDELESFVLSVKRHVSGPAIANALDALEGKFSIGTIKAVKRLAEAAPTEPQIADEILQAHNLLYVNNVGFYEWNGKVWAPTEDSTVKRYVNDTYGRFATYQRVSAVCNLLKILTATETRFDKAPVLTFQNGTLEIETGTFRGHSPSDFCSIIMEYDYDPAAKCPVWESFITDVTNDEPIREEILQFIAGYVLFPDCKHQKLFVLVGAGGNGKSVYIETVQRLFGDKNVTHVEPSGLTGDFQRIRLKDSLLNIGSDINSDFSRGEIREWLLKIVDGTSIQACYKGKDYIDFIPRCKLVYACNELPTADIVKGLDRRLHFVTFPCKYVFDPDPSDPLQRKRDVDLAKKLDPELSGIFNWAYAGYKLLRTVGYFTDEPEQNALLQQFAEISDPVAVFCEEQDFVGEVTRNEIYQRYRVWCDTTGHTPMSRERFLPKFRDHMGGRITTEKQVRRGDARVRVFVF